MTKNHPLPKEQQITLTLMQQCIWKSMPLIPPLILNRKDQAQPVEKFQWSVPPQKNSDHNEAYLSLFYSPHHTFLRLDLEAYDVCRFLTVIALP